MKIILYFKFHISGQKDKLFGTLKNLSWVNFLYSKKDL